MFLLFVLIINQTFIIICRKYKEAERSQCDVLSDVIILLMLLGLEYLTNYVLAHTALTAGAPDGADHALSCGQFLTCLWIEWSLNHSCFPFM